MIQNTFRVYLILGIIRILDFYIDM